MKEFFACLVEYLNICICNVHYWAIFLSNHCCYNSEWCDQKISMVTINLPVVLFLDFVLKHLLY